MASADSNHHLPVPSGPAGLKKKKTQGWMVYGGKRHAEPPRGVSPRGYWEQVDHS